MKKQLIRTYEKSIRFRIETRYHLELLRSETMKLLGSTKSKITNDD